MLLRSDANVNARGPEGLTPLHRAAQQNYIKMVKLLIRHDAQVDARHDQGETPLLVATIASNPDVVRFLLAKADVNAANKESVTPFAGCPRTCDTNT